MERQDFAQPQAGPQFQQEQFIVAVLLRLDESPLSILNMLYEAYNEINLMDDDKVKQDFHELYELMNGMPLREIDQIVYPV